MKLETQFRQQAGYAIQPCGALLAFRTTDDCIALASENISNFLGHEFSEGVLGMHVREVLGSSIFHALRNVVSLPSIRQRREYLGQHQLHARELDVWAYQCGGLVVAEFTLAHVDPMPGPYDILKDVALFRDRIQAAGSDVEIFRGIVTLLRTISGYDCVAACRYQGNGTSVLASAGDALSAEVTMEVNSRFHLVVDSMRRPVNIRRDVDTEAFDLSLSVLQYPSSATCEKMNAIGARASVMQGIQVGQHVWGYLVFLHRTARTANHRTRLVLAHLQPLLSARLNSLGT